jgi:hypothetical protein
MFELIGMEAYTSLISAIFASFSAAWIANDFSFSLICLSAQLHKLIAKANPKVAQRQVREFRIEDIWRSI